MSDEKPPNGKRTYNPKETTGTLRDSLIDIFSICGLECGAEQLADSILHPDVIIYYDPEKITIRKKGDDKPHPDGANLHKAIKKRRDPKRQLVQDCPPEEYAKSYFHKADSSITRAVRLERFHDAVQERIIALEDGQQTRLEGLDCHWFQQMHPTFEPGGKINVLTYQSRISRVICPHLVSGKCTSGARPEDSDLCYVWDEEKT